MPASALGGAKDGLMDGQWCGHPHSRTDRFGVVFDCFFLGGLLVIVNNVFFLFFGTGYVITMTCQKKAGVFTTRFCWAFVGSFHFRQSSSEPCEPCRAPARFIGGEWVEDWFD